MEKRQFSGMFRMGATSRPWGRRHASAMLVAFAVSVSGCATQQGQNPSGSVIDGPTQGTQLGSNLNGFLSQSGPGATVVLQDSPWGGNVEVMADATYYAASGRDCRQLQIMQLQGGNVRSAVACKTSDGSWVSQRLVTQTQAGRMSR
ncbi:DVU3141 family protein [Halomonas caseinilytica]|uniref:Common-antigen outer membrane protein n=1 Tax=Halomonas caseinilytica TaxID=438744 RepID=A0A1M6NMI5_9GAMM|nr:DVU3141 family protein [Halomonas caseinilytica]SHJ96772.1 common-antigen outer membrane protein [Halomonas caseinilytica]